MSELAPTPLAAQAASEYQAGNFLNAARLFGEAASALLAADSAPEAAEMKNNQSVAWLRAGKMREAFEAAHGTASVFAAIGDARREGISFGNEAAALQALGRTQEALETYRLAADAFEHAGEDQMRAAVTQAMAGMELKQGKIMKALLTMQTGLIGVKHPTLKQKIMRALLRLQAW